MHSIGNTGEDDIMINFLFEKEYFNERFFSHFSKENILLQFLLNAISEKKIHDNFILFHSERSTRIQLFMQELIIEFLGSPAESSVDVIDNPAESGKRKMYGGHEIYRGQLQELHAGVCGGDVQYESQLSFRHAEEKHGVFF